VETRDLANGACMLRGRIGLMGLAMVGVGGGKKENGKWELEGGEKEGKTIIEESIWRRKNMIRYAGEKNWGRLSLRKGKEAKIELSFGSVIWRRIDNKIMQ
jgi:hypothetical protein